MKLKTLTAVLAASLSVAQAEKLTIWMVGDDNNGTRIMQAAADLFQTKNKDVTFEIRNIPWSDAYTKYLAAIASKSGPDIITGGLSFGISLGKQGGLVNIGKDYPAFAAQVKKVAQKGVMKSITSLDGSLYAVPYNLDVQLMYYRKDTLKDMKISLPKNWDQLTKANDKLKAAGKKPFMQQWGNANWLGFFPFFYQAGGEFYDDKCSKSTINSAEGVQALKYYAELYTKYKAPTDGWPDIEAALDSGDAALTSTGPWTLASIDASRPKLQGKWGIAKMPAGPSGKSTAFIGGSTIMVMSYSKNKELAMKYLQHLYTTSAARAMINASTKLGSLWIPARTDLASLLNLPADRKSALIAQLKDAEGPSNCPGWEESGDAVTQAIQQVIFSGQDPKAALDAAAKVMDRNLAKR